MPRCTARSHQLQTYKEEIPDLFRAERDSGCVGWRVYAGWGRSPLTLSALWRGAPLTAGDGNPLGACQRTGDAGARRLRAGTPVGLHPALAYFEDDGGLVRKSRPVTRFCGPRRGGERTEKRAPGGSGKGAWGHTQGAGESLEMTCLQGKLIAPGDEESERWWW